MRARAKYFANLLHGVNKMKIKYKTTSNLLYHAVQKVASDELAELQKLMQ